VIEMLPPPGPCNGDLEGANKQQGLIIDHNTIVSRWAGERLNLGYVVNCVVESEGWKANAAARAAAKEGVGPRAGPSG
jgi:hypothetical protein